MTGKHIIAATLASGLLLGGFWEQAFAQTPTAPTVQEVKLEENRNPATEEQNMVSGQIAKEETKQDTGSEKVKSDLQPETEKKYPITIAVEGQTDVVEFRDDRDGFRVWVPAELTVYPLGINPVAVFRGENTATGLRLAIDASAIDNKGPLMPFQVEEFRSDFIRLVKNSVKESANDKKISLCKEEEINGRKAVHVVSTNLTADGKRRFLRDEYVFVTQNRMFVVMYMMDEKLYLRYSAKIPEWMQSVEISQVWKKINIKGTSFATEVPASCIDLKDPTELKKTMEIYGNESIMIGLVASPREQSAFMPESLKGLTTQEQGSILEGLREKLAADTKDSATGYKGEFTEANGIVCVKGTYEVNGSRNESYTFVKDGKVIELGFVYKGEQEKAVRPVIVHAVDKLSL